jgi:putative acetyltransferase
MPEAAATLRPYRAADEAAAIELWRRTWQQAYPAIDFAARVAWWRERWRSELVPAAAIVVAEAGGALVGFVTVDAATGYLDQIVVAPETWGTGVAEMLLDEAKRRSPARLELHVNTDNARAVGFYRKHGFALAGEDVNPRSGAPVYLMRWEKGRMASSE